MKDCSIDHLSHRGLLDLGLFYSEPAVAMSKFSEKVYLI